MYLYCEQNPYIGRSYGPTDLSVYENGYSDAKNDCRKKILAFKNNFRQFKKLLSLDRPEICPKCDNTFTFKNNKSIKQYFAQQTSQAIDLIDSNMNYSFTNKALSSLSIKCDLEGCSHRFRIIDLKSYKELLQIVKKQDTERKSIIDKHNTEIKKNQWRFLEVAIAILIATPLILWLTHFTFTIILIIELAIILISNILFLLMNYDIIKFKETDIIDRFILLQ